MRDNCRRIKQAIEKTDLEQKIEVYAAYFANSHPRLFQIIAEEGFGAVVQSVEEVAQLQNNNITKNMKIIASPGIISKEDLDYFLNNDIRVNLSNWDDITYVLQHPIKKKTVTLGIRIDCSDEQNQRFGFKINMRHGLDYKKTIKRNIEIIHSYPGTESSYEKLIQHAKKMFFLFLKDCKTPSSIFNLGTYKINLGGGFLFDYEAKNPEEKHFPWNKYFHTIKKLAKEYRLDKIAYDKVTIEIGAYGACQHMEFLNKRPAPEVLIRENGTIELITERGSYTDRIRYALKKSIKIG